MKQRKHFADFYDAISEQDSARSRAQKVLSFIRRHAPHAQSILELGVGNGSVLAAFPSKYNLSGIDIEPRYIKLAKKKCPRAKLKTASMHRFHFGRKFQALFSIFNCLNYLSDLQKYEQTFQSAAAHLEPGGIFIFDVHTPKLLSHDWKPLTEKHSFGYFTEFTRISGNKITWDFHFFEERKGHYDLHVFPVTVRLFSPREIEKRARKWFTIIEKLDSDTLKMPTAKTENLLYVLRKK